jgi:hypothetical protein
MGRRSVAGSGYRKSYRTRAGVEAAEGYMMYNFDNLLSSATEMSEIQDGSLQY